MENKIMSSQKSYINRDPQSRLSVEVAFMTPKAYYLTRWPSAKVITALDIGD